MFAALVSCGSSDATPVAPNSPDGGTTTDGADSTGLVDGVSIHVRHDLCGGVPGATVQVLDGTPQGTTDADGNVKLDRVPIAASLLFRAPGNVDTITSVRAFASNAKTEIEITPQKFYTLAYVLAGVTPDPELGAAVISVINEVALPIAGVQVELVGVGTDTGTRRYVSANVDVTNATFDAKTTETQPRIGFVVFLNVPPGTYQVKGTRGSDVFPPMTMIVRAGAVTGDDLVRPGSEGTEPAVMTGLITASPALPSYGPAVPAAKMPFVIHDIARDRDFPVTTGADGKYSATLPFARGNVDLTFTKAPYAERSFEVCVGSFMNTQDWGIQDHFWDALLLAPTLGGAALDPTRGSVMVWADKAGSADPALGYAGATVTVDPAGAKPYYAPQVSQGCVTASTCKAKADCPATSRCEGGVCLLGAAAPACSLAAATCPTGYLRWPVPEQSKLVWRCLPSVADCAGPAPVCQTGMYCAVSAFNDSGVLLIQPPSCFPQDASGTATAVTTSGQSQLVALPNLAPAEYTIRLNVPGQTFEPTKVRVSPGVTTQFGYVVP